MSSQSENKFVVMKRGFFNRPDSSKTKIFIKRIAKPIFLDLTVIQTRGKGNFFLDSTSAQEKSEFPASQCADKMKYGYKHT